MAGPCVVVGTLHLEATLPIGQRPLLLATIHGFLNDHPPEDMTPLTVLLSKLSGTRYHEPSARDARLRIIAFFDAHLKS